MTAGLLEMDVVCGKGSRTQVARLAQRFPQRITAPMYLDEADTGRAHVCVQNPTGGVFPGDRLRTLVRVGNGARLYLTAQSATQVYAPHADSPEGGAASDAVFEVGDGAVLEHFPKTVIPHAGSEYRQTTSVNVEGCGVFIGWESLAAGRIGHGERFEYLGYEARTTLRLGGRALARERLVLRPGEADVTGPGVCAPGVLGGHDYLGTLSVVAPERNIARLRSALLVAVSDLVGANPAAPDDQGPVCGVSELPDKIGVTARVLARGAPALARAQEALRAVIRSTLFGDTGLLGDTVGNRRPTTRM